jgi:hypothetical protein
MPSPPKLKDETDSAVPLWGMFAAEIRYRAASDTRYLLPVRRSVKASGSGA